MRSKLIALFAAAAVLAGIPTALAVASPDTKTGSKDSSSKLEKKYSESGDRSVDTSTGKREASSGDSRQDASKTDDAWDDSPDGQAGTVISLSTSTSTDPGSIDNSNDGSKVKDSSKEGPHGERQSKDDRHFDE